MNFLSIFSSLLILSTFLNSTNLKIASYNVENLFDMHRDGTEYPQYIPNKHNWTTAILDKKLTNISEVICEIDADIIGLQEVENLNVLKLLQTSLRKFGCSYRYSAITHKPKSAIQVALLSKIPIESSTDLVVTRSLGIRNILETKFIVKNRPLYIFVNHWNSKRSPESRRIISAIALKKRLLSLKEEYILLGDFNSNYNEYRSIKKTGINHTLVTIKDQKLLRKLDLIRESFQHYNLWLEKPIYKRWSYNFYGKKEGLDAILVPYEMFDGRGVDYINNSFDIFKPNYLFAKKGYILRWKYKRKRHIGIGYSDHLPIVARFSTDPYLKSNSDISNGSIVHIFRKQVHFPLLLKNIKVVSVKKKLVIIEDSSGSITIYGIDTPLEVDKRYDIVVYKRKFYHGRYEIVDFRVEKRYDSIKKRIQ